MLHTTDILILFVSGVVAGIISAVAGGAGLFTFPALIYIGLNPIVASASNFVALAPSGLAATYAARRQLDGAWGRLLGLLPTTSVGAVCGAMLLVRVPAALFAQILSALLLIATLLFAIAPMLGPLGDASPASKWAGARFLETVRRATLRWNEGRAWTTRTI